MGFFCNKALQKSFHSLCLHIKKGGRGGSGQVEATLTHKHTRVHIDLSSFCRLKQAHLDSGCMLGVLLYTPKYSEHTWRHPNSSRRKHERLNMNTNLFSSIREEYLPNSIDLNVFSFDSGTVEVQMLSGRRSRDRIPSGKQLGNVLFPIPFSNSNMIELMTRTFLGSDSILDLE